MRTWYVTVSRWTEYANGEPVTEHGYNLTDYGLPLLTSSLIVTTPGNETVELTLDKALHYRLKLLLAGHLRTASVAIDPLLDHSAASQAAGVVSAACAPSSSAFHQQAPLTPRRQVAQGSVRTPPRVAGASRASALSSAHNEPRLSASGSAQQQQQQQRQQRQRQQRQRQQQQQQQRGQGNDASGSTVGSSATGPCSPPPRPSSTTASEPPPSNRTPTLPYSNAHPDGADAAQRASSVARDDAPLPVDERSPSTAGAQPPTVNEPAFRAIGRKRAIDLSDEARQADSRLERKHTDALALERVSALAPADYCTATPGSCDPACPLAHDIPRKVLDEGCVDCRALQDEVADELDPADVVISANQALDQWMHSHERMRKIYEQLAASEARDDQEMAELVASGIATKLAEREKPPPYCPKLLSCRAEPSTCGRSHPSSTKIMQARCAAHQQT